MGEPYLDTELIKQRRAEQKKEKERIAQLQELLNINEREARNIYHQANSSKSQIKRPDKYFKSKKQGIDHTIKYDLVPEIISTFNLDKEGNALKDCQLFHGKYRWIKKIDNNAGM